MSQCSFEGVSIGDVVTLHGIHNQRCSCGTALVGDLTGVYEGHITDGETYDLVRLTGYLKCQSCGFSLTRYVQKCNSGGVWMFSDHQIQEVNR